jgi:hypothetical protein
MEFAVGFQENKKIWSMSDDIQSRDVNVDGHVM